MNVFDAIKHFYPYKYKDIIETYSNECKIDPLLVAALIKTESGFDNNAISGKNATGLMQITPSTGKWIANQIGEEYKENSTLLNPELNIKFGCWYLNYLESYYKGDLTIVLAAYNGGLGNVNKWLSDSKLSKNGTTLDEIPFKETDSYIKKIIFNYKIYKYIYKEK